MVMVCKDYIRQLCLNVVEETENLWKAMDTEIKSRNACDSHDHATKIFKSQVEARLNKVTSWMRIFWKFAHFQDLIAVLNSALS